MVPWKDCHSGRNETRNEDERSGYWSRQDSSVVNWVISKCFTCKRLWSRVDEEVYLLDRSKEKKLFTYCGLHMSGPFPPREQIRCYGVLLTRVVSRAIHIKNKKSKEPDSFILAFKRFICIRGNVRSNRHGNGKHLKENRGNQPRQKKKQTTVRWKDIHKYRKKNIFDRLLKFYIK